MWHEIAQIWGMHSISYISIRRMALKVVLPHQKAFRNLTFNANICVRKFKWGGSKLFEIVIG